MAIKDLFFSLFAKDQTGGAFDSMNRNFVKAEGHAVSFADKANRAGKTLRNFGLAGSAASAGIVAAFRGSIGLWDVQAKAEAKVAAAVRATGGAAGFTAKELYKQASALQNVTRFGDENILDNVTAQLLTFKNISGDAFIGAQTAALDLATVLNSDPKSAAIMLGKALNDPAKGLSALSRAGVTFSEGQTEVIKALAGTGKIAEAQKMILEEIASAYGGQATAARDAGSGILEAWSNTWGDIKEEVGRVLLDLLRVIVPPLQALATAFGDLSPGMKRFVITAGAVAVVLPPLVAGFGLLVIGASALSAPVLAVVAGFAALTAGVALFLPQVIAVAGWVAKTWGEMSTFEKVLGPAGVAVHGLSGAFAEAFPEMSAYLSDALSSVVDFATTTWDQFSLAEMAFGPLSGVISDLWDLFAQAFPGIAATVSDTVGAIVGLVKDQFLPIMDAIGAKVKWVEEQFRWLWSKVTGGGAASAATVADEFAGIVPAMVDPTKAAVDGVKGEIDTIPDIIIPPIVKATHGAGKAMKGLHSKITKPVNKAKEDVETDLDRMADSLSGAFVDMAKNGEVSWKNMWSAFKDVSASYADDILGGVMKDLSSGLSAAFASSRAAGSGGVAAGGGGLGGIISSLGTAAKGLFGFDTGGTFTVRGRAGIDRNTASVRLSEGEDVIVKRRGQASGGGTTNVYIQTPDPAAFRASQAQIGARISRAVAAGGRMA